MTANPSLAHCSQSGAGSERLLLSVRREGRPPSWFLRPRSGAGLKPRRPSIRCYRKLWPAARELWKLEPSPHLPITATPGWKTNSHLADCFHHSQASRPAEPFGKEMDRKLSLQTENPQNDQPQVTTLLLQMKEESKAHLQPGVTKSS